MKYRTNSYKYDIYGFINSSEEFGTTFANEGYDTIFQVGNKDYRYITKFNTDTEIDGIKVNVSLSDGSDGKSVIVKYSFTNVSGEKLTFKIGTYADNLLAHNDEAAIYKDGHSKIIVTQDNLTTYPETYGTQFSISFSPEVSTSWLGVYDYNEAITDHMFDDGDVLSLSNSS